jgi:hypothetical protein
MAGKKFDAGKAPLTQGCLLYFPDALQAVALVSDYGRNKYETTFAERNWYYVPDAVGRYADGLSRHIVKEATEGMHDDESGLLHAAHAAWNALARLQLLLEQEGLLLAVPPRRPYVKAETYPTPDDDGVPF